MTTDSASPDRRIWIREALARGWRKRCPHCGEGALFSGWVTQLPRCGHCGLVYERNPGDTWAFTIVGDRMPLAGMLIVIYLGLLGSHPLAAASVIGLLWLAFFWTTTNRWGIGIALHYISRRLWVDPDDPVPGGEGSRSGAPDPPVPLER